MAAGALICHADCRRVADGRWDSNLIEKRSCDKKFGMGGRNKEDRKTHRRRPLHATREHGMAAAGSYLPCRLKAGELHMDRITI